MRRRDRAIPGSCTQIVRFGDAAHAGSTNLRQLRIRQMAANFLLFVETRGIREF
jgi:hypothetical protein